MQAAQRAEQLKIYASAYQELVDALAGFPREMWQYRPSPDDWTIHEIIIHITDSEANSFVRARRLLAEPGLDLMAYDEMVWAVQLDYHHLSPVTALELFRWLRQSTFELIHEQPEEAWAHTAFHPESGDITLDDWLNTYAGHVRDHIAQMNRVYEAWLETGA